MPKLLRNFVSIDKGFTLVEIMLTVGIITLLTAAVIPTIGNFTDANIVTQGAQNLASDIENAKFKALSGIYGDTAGTYRNWGFSCSNSNNTSYSLTSYTPWPSNVANTAGARNVPTLSGVTLNCNGSNTVILFERITGKVLLGGNSLITLTKNTKVMYVRVDSVGNINICKTLPCN